MWPTAADVKLSQHAGPSSPPQTPRTASPLFGRETSPPPPGELPPQHPPLRPMAPPLATSQVAAKGPSFSHSRAIRPDHLSPRTTSSSSPPDSDSDSGGSVGSDDSDGSEDAGPPPSVSSGGRSGSAPHAPQRTGRIVTRAEFVVEELSDFGDSDGERLGVIRPCAIEYAESDRSRSRSRNAPDIDQRIMYNLGNLNCGDDSDETDFDEREYHEFLVRRRAEKRRKRMTSGSIGKRTISESIGSDTDLEDLKPFLNADEIGSSARRLRRRIGDRHSLQFQDPPPPPRIDELDEPDSSESEILVGESLARELPYYEYVSMEVDSP